MPALYNKVGKALPSSNADGASVQQRGWRYGEGVIVPAGDGIYPFAEEGSYFKAINPTPGTGIAQTIKTSFDSQNAVFCIRNGDGAGGKRLHMDYLRLICTVVGTSTTRSEGLIAIDNITRYSSGGSAITIAGGANMDVGTASIAVVHFGALSLAAESGSVRRISRFQLRTAIMVQYEEWIIKFGRPEGGGQETLSGSSALRTWVPVGPGVLGDGDSLTVHIWNTGNASTAPSWEFEAGWIER
jgi:hypothetical protein